MMRTRALASIAIVLVGGVSLLAATVWSKNSTPAADHRATLDQYCFRCHSSTAPRAGVNLRALDFNNLEDNGAIWEKVLRKLRSHEMPPPGRWRPDAGLLRDPRQIYRDRTRSPGGGQAQSGTARRSIASIGPNTPTRSAICWRSRSMLRTCCRPTTSATASTISATCCRYRRCCWNGISRRPARSAGWPSATPRLPSSYQTYAIPHGLNQRDRMSEDMPLGSRGGTSISHRFPVDGEYEISVGLQTGRFDEYSGARARTQARSQARRSDGSSCSPSAADAASAACMATGQ